jgi:membrane protein YdbS with pleckstrin-like domain
METLHPRVRFVWGTKALLTGLVLGAIVVGVDRFLTPVGRPVAVGAGVALAAAGLVHALLRYRAWGFTVGEDDLYLERGVLTKVETSVPYVRVQHVDTQRGPVQRTLGLASVVVYTAGSRGADVAIPGLGPERARELREQLRDLAIESEGADAV